MVQPVSYPKPWKTVTQWQKTYSGLQGALALLGWKWKKGSKTLSMVPERPAGKCETGNKFTSISLVPYQKRLLLPPKKCLLVDITPIISKFVGDSCVITYYVIPWINWYWTLWFTKLPGGLVSFIRNDFLQCFVVHYLLPFCFMNFYLSH